jgi:hypothetical protein
MSKRKKAKAKPKAKVKKTAKRKAPAPAGLDKKAREMVALLIDKLGASSAVYENRADQLIVSHFNHAPFIVDLRRREVVEVPVAATTVDTADQQSTAA